MFLGRMSPVPYCQRYVLCLKEMQGGLTHTETQQGTYRHNDVHQLLPTGVSKHNVVSFNNDNVAVKMGQQREECALSLAMSLKTSAAGRQGRQSHQKQ